MSELNCERVCMAAMAIADGSQSELSSDQIEAHLSGCSDCRREMAQLHTLTNLLDGQVRRQRTEDVWERVEEQLPGSSQVERTSLPWHPFMLLGVLLLGYRIVEMLPDRHLGVLFKVVPVLFAIAAFTYLRENPFKIHSELRLEGE
jgi:anti-sigma factor RsiW